MACSLIAVYYYCRPCADKYFCFLLSFEDFIILIQPFLGFTISLFEKSKNFFVRFLFFCRN